MTGLQIFLLCLVGAGIVIGLWGLRWLWLLAQSEQRLAAGTAALDVRDADQVPTQRSWLGWWLFRAGFRKKNAVTLFMLATGVSVLMSVLFAYVIYQSQVLTVLEMVLRAIPGNVGEVFLPLAWLSPVAAIFVLAGLPAVIVRGRRRKRVTQIEQDLPLTLDLLATLAEAGLSFDAALDRVLETQRRQRPLAEDFRLFRLEILTGRGRVDALQRLNQYVNVPWFGIFVSALIHAEQVGSGLAATLRAQADDLRSRRRERALAMAMAVPVKLLFPLITCFLPGIMIASLGPIIFQIVQVLDQFTRSAFGG
ncbi:Bacterial type II secretion system protein F domain protein [Roseimaritima multifibrata]|uniref:Bacterial type II secretion system protein F domain protein n=1 Tax=Roseimaritima multifibrata TaxID=1930274 RepID=A0A517MA03_9BACT|nr:type II secretion system F family protein [Roseimaritima multifibrata]QDS91720.1 Bacterial type II secretion system protein F domain protein [Roseimaritima multifibrata]